jgi:hypothetical protein
MKRDTFIRPEIQSLHRVGADVKVISVRKPLDAETTPDTQWSKDTYFILPQSALSVAWALFATAISFPNEVSGCLIPSVDQILPAGQPGRGDIAIEIGPAVCK